VSRKSNEKHRARQKKKAKELFLEGLTRRLESERQEGLAKALATLGVQKQNAPTE